MSARAAILMAGGAGTRLWPLSTAENPKQFLPLFEGRSLLQMAFERMREILPGEAIFISTGEQYREKVANQLPELEGERILVEPSRRNTAPAIAVCSAEVARILGGDPVIGIFPSDHHIADPRRFLEVVERAYRFAAREPYLMTIGIDPDHPNTGFGYLEVGREIEPGVVRVEHFIEKPSKERAEELVRSGKFVWNGGMFVWRQSVFAKALGNTAPALAELTREYGEASGDVRREVYERMPSISIDFAVMEKAPDVATARGEFGWSDVGSWSAVARIAGEGRTDGVTRVDAGNVLVESEGSRPIVILGVSGIALVDAPEGLLVIDLSRSEELGPIVKKLTG